jgi:CRP-like cAMP-binding protein
MPVPVTRESVANNCFLASLPAKDFESVKELLDFVELETETVLWRSDEKGRFLYFPTTCLISLLYDSDSGNSVSIATIGRSGLVGTNIVLGGARTPDKAIVQLGGAAFRMVASSAKEELADCGDFQSLLMTFTQVLITRVSQNAICNRLHKIEQQLARWILDCCEELQTETLKMTHEQIANVLGVRRESVSLAMAQHEGRGLIKGGRGRVTILDRKKLEDASCECFAIVRDQLERSVGKFNSERA